MREYAPSEIEACARAAHEANRAYCAFMGDYSHKSWDEAPDWQKESARDGVLNIVRENIATAQQSHEGWMRHKLAAGWRYGAVKDADKKEHPSLVEFDKLPFEEQAKDHLYIAVVRAMLNALNSQPV